MVAPRAGAWIETGSFQFLIFRSESRPARARGLKPVMRATINDVAVSRPARARGLNLSTTCAAFCAQLTGCALRGQVD